MKYLKSLYVQVIIAILAGILLGALYPSFAVKLKPLGDGFIKLVKMMISPIIFCTIISGIAGMQDTRKLGRVGLKAIIYFEVITTLALIIGLVVINTLKPGVGMNIDPSTLDIKSAEAYLPKSQTSGWQEFLLHIIPESIVNSLATNNLLQILFFSILLGFALSKIGAKAKPLLSGIKSLEVALFAVIKIIMKVAPLGALGAMAFTIGKYGLDSLTSLGSLMLSFYITCILFIVIILGGILKYYGFNLFLLLKYIREELLIVLGTSSSEAALPSLMNKLEKMGCSESVVGLVVPTGYSFNLDGTSIYLTMAAVFLAQATNTPLDISHQITLLLVLLLASKGAAGVTGSGFITLAAVLPVAGQIPVASIALILGIDRFMSEGRAITNIIGNTIATIIIAKSENEIDFSKTKECNL
ncbi:MAG: C4-dicarboxylate transporter DctA [Bacteroidetes bacterium GWE2_41_25]|nr:MAG: C4-dicarboxylate transporter DctA [Bacteroidetes bacterium GWA2_40_15]OFX96444.1 MAG: C4-dicarboxylate transporter DctA [Bacteroidetes bacterium GWC2_40_22]OFX97147.1 MAG: C4-dicarboxylate transporter DctA [Bacteroidetes bacterium GWE2_41_25]HBH82581.1 C4-dicarboxylate transporter DctA [Bacteroidales bacterium]HBQ81710.1 C4-dicarboxylate transporter DctA [Bacteroidales bacterium]